MRVTRLGEVARIYNGNSINEKVKAEKFTGFMEGTPYISTKDISYTYQVKYENGVRIPSSNANEFRIAKKGSVLLCAEGGSAGRKMAIIDRDVYFVNKLFCFECNTEISSKFLFYYLQTPSFQILFKNSITGLIGGVSLEKVRNLPLVLPSLDKQAEIVEKLDSAFAEIDALGEGITARIENVLELFAKICTEKTQELNPNGFKSLKEIATVITKGTTPTSLGYKFTSSGINFLKVESLDENGGFIGNKFAYIDSDCHASLKRSQLEESDVLISIAGALGRTAIVTRDICPANVNQALSLIRLPKDSEISPKFLFALFQAGYFKFELDQMGAGAAQQNLSLAQIGSLKVPIFPEVKQLEFIEFLIKLRELVTVLKKHLEIQNILKLELKKSILTTTFSISSSNELVA